MRCSWLLFFCVMQEMYTGPESSLPSWSVWIIAQWCDLCCQSCCCNTGESRNPVSSGGGGTPTTGTLTDSNRKLTVAKHTPGTHSGKALIMIITELDMKCVKFVSVSFEQVKTHIQTYLKNLEENLLSREDRTELYLLFVNCFQVKDSDFTPFVLSPRTLRANWWSLFLFLSFWPHVWWQ